MPVFKPYSMSYEVEGQKEKEPINSSIICIMLNID